jgi:hypothetical protein
LHQLVDKLLTVARVTTLVEVVALLLPAAQGVAKLERPQEVVGLLEVGAHSVNLVDEVLNAEDVLGAEGLGDDLVLGQRDALLVDFTETTFVDEVVDGLQARLAVGHVRLDETQHSHGGVVDLHESSVVDLTQAQELQDFLGLGGHTHDTADADNEEELGHVLDEVVAGILGLATGADEGLLVLTVLLHVLLGALEDHLTVGFVGLGEKENLFVIVV